VAFTGRLVGWCAGAGVESYAARVRSGTRGSGQRGGRGVAGGGVLLLQCCCCSAAVWGKGREVSLGAAATYRLPPLTHCQWERVASEPPCLPACVGSLGFHSSVG
jgi:hypothetical protein